LRWNASFLLRLSAPQLSIELFLQLVIEGNAADLATPVFDPVSHLVVQAVKIGIVVRFLWLHKSRVNGLVFRYETLSPNQAFPLLGEGENLPGFLLQNARFPSFNQPLVEKAIKIVLHPQAVAGVSQSGEILDSDTTWRGNPAKLVRYNRRADASLSGADQRELEAASRIAAE